MQQDVGPGS